MAVNGSALSIKRSTAISPLSSWYLPGITSAGLKVTPAASKAAR